MLYQSEEECFMLKSILPKFYFQNGEDYLAFIKSIREGQMMVNTITFFSSSNLTHINFILMMRMTTFDHYIHVKQNWTKANNNREP